MVKDHGYYKSQIYGPIHFSELENYQTFKLKYPLLRLDNIKQRFPDLHISIKWTKDECLDRLEEFISSNKRLPQRREFKKPSASTITELFGSWNKFILEAGYEPVKTNSYGVITKGLDGNIYLSKAEATFANLYLFQKFEYSYEPPYGNGWFYDFYIKELDTYVEIDGNLRPERIKQKLEFNKSHNRNCVVIPISKVVDSFFVSEKLGV